MSMGHCVQVSDDTAATFVEKYDSKQSLHMSALSPPVMFRYLPARHGWHTAPPALSAYLPSTHAVHVEALYCCAVGETLPATHLTHEPTVRAPSGAEYVPISHGAQCVRFPVIALVPAEQFWHDATTTTPAPVTYCDTRTVPSTQPTHTELPPRE